MAFLTDGLFFCSFFEFYYGDLRSCKYPERNEYAANAATDKECQSCAVKYTVYDFSSRKLIFSNSHDLDPERHADLTAVNMT